MRTPLSQTNPFAHNRYGYLWEMLAARPSGRHLDYGSYDGAVVCRLAVGGVIAHGVGLDANEEVVLRNRPNAPPNVELFATTTPGIPFPDDTFDSASVLDVIEHVVDQDALLAELHRVLKPGGVLIVTTPRRYRLSFLDTGNWKFRFPRAHRLVVIVLHGRAYYRSRYVECRYGLFGDIEVGKGCHEHFSIDGLAKLLGRNGFELTNYDGAGYAGRILVLFKPLGVVGPARRWLARASECDAMLHEAANLFATFQSTK